MMKKLLIATGMALITVTGALAQTVKLTSSLGDATVATEINNPIKFTLTCSEPATLTINVNGAEDIATAENATELMAEFTCTDIRKYNVYGNALLANGTTKSTSLSFTYTNSSPQVNYPGGVPKMGPVANADGSVTFCIAAPDKQGASIIGSWDNYSVDNAIMNYQDYQGIRYFWKTIPDIDPTAQYIYGFQIDGGNVVGDPYARLVLDPSSDNSIKSSVYPNLPKYPAGKFQGNNCVAVYQGNINDFNWTDDDFVIPNKSDLIVYELLFRDFTGTEGRANGNGTVNLALEKLPYLKALGVNCIELMPINEFNGNNSWGYNPNFFFAPDKAYGTPDDYKNFINTCHENGIAVVLDMVFNQTDWQHPWYLLYPAGQNPMYNATAPHAYSVLNDMNQGHPLIRQQEDDAVKYWLEEYHVDGFRFDLVKGLGDNNSYSNNSSAATEAYNKSRIDNMARIQKAMEEVKPGAIFINEDLAGSREETDLGKLGMLQWANINHSGKQYALGYNSDANLNRMLATKDSRPFGSTVSYLESHDEQRLAYEQDNYGVAGVKGNLAVSMRRLGSAAAQMIMAPGAHMIWMFSELGNNENTKSNDGNNLTGPKKVLWSYYDEPDRRGLYDNYAECINIRLNNPELFTENSGFNLNYAGWTLGRTFHSSAAGKELHLLVNPQTNKELTMNVSFNSTNQDDYKIASKSYNTNPTFSVADGTVTIPANSYVIITNNAVDTSDVKEIQAEMAGSQPVSSEWYTLTGSRIQNPDKGIYIQVVKYADGTTKSFKIAK